jgi:hypothetical protein
MEVESLELLWQKAPLPTTLPNHPQERKREAPSLHYTSHWLHENFICKIGHHYFWLGLIAVPRTPYLFKSTLIFKQPIIWNFQKIKKWKTFEHLIPCLKIILWLCFSSKWKVERRNFENHSSLNKTTQKRSICWFAASTYFVQQADFFHEHQCLPIVIITWITRNGLVITNHALLGCDINVSHIYKCSKYEKNCFL